MKKDLFDIQQHNFQFFKDYSFLFENKVPPSKTPTDYLTMCGYDDKCETLMSGGANFGFFYPDILTKYKENFLFFLPSQEQIGYSFVFNFGGHRHLWTHVHNMPDETNTKPRFVVFPIFYASKHSDILEFFQDNQEFLIHPSEKTVGFRHFSTN